MNFLNNPVASLLEANSIKGLVELSENWDKFADYMNYKDENGENILHSYLSKVHFQDVKDADLIFDEDEEEDYIKIKTKSHFEAKKLKSFLSHYCTKNYLDHKFFVSQFPILRDREEAIRNLNQYDHFILYLHKKGVDMWQEPNLPLIQMFFRTLNYMESPNVYVKEKYAQYKQKKSVDVQNKKTKRHIKKIKAYPYDTSIKLLLSEKSLDFNNKKNQKYLFLHHAVLAENKYLFKHLVEIGHPTNVFDEQGEPASFCTSDLDMLNFLNHNNVPLKNKDSSKTYIDHLENAPIVNERKR